MSLVERVNCLRKSGIQWADKQRPAIRLVAKSAIGVCYGTIAVFFYAFGLLVMCFVFPALLVLALFAAVTFPIWAWRLRVTHRKFVQRMKDLNAFIEWGEVENSLERGTGILLVDVGAKGFHNRGWYFENTTIQGCEMTALSSEGSVADRITRLFHRIHEGDASDWYRWAERTVVPIADKAKMVRVELDQLEALHWGIKEKFIHLIPWPCSATPILERWAETLDTPKS